MAEYKFDDIAINSTAKKKPLEEDKYHYLGLEHLDSGTFTVSRFGSDVAPIGDKLIMKKGDVLFGKRRAYQKKVAIAPFDGIFSAHGMVLRPKEDVIDKDFFPLFIASDYFLDDAIKISVGSLSPTINWRDLKELKFNLPTIEEQKKLADTLWQIVATMERYKKLLAKTDEMVKAKFIKMFGDPISNPKGWEIKKLPEISKYHIGLTYKPSDTADDGILVLRSGNIQDSKLVFDDNVFVKCDVNENLIVRENDILMCSRNGSANLVGKVALIPKLENRTTYGAFMTIIRSNYAYYLFSYFQQPCFRIQIRGTQTATVNQITQSMLDKIEIPLPPMELQNQFAEFVKKTEESKSTIQTSLDSLTKVYKKIIAENLGGIN